MSPPPRWPLRLIRIIDEFNRLIGIAAIWLVLLCALVSAANAVIRYSSGGLLWLQTKTGIGLFGWLYTLYADNSNALSDTTWYMFAATVPSSSPGNSMPARSTSPWPTCSHSPSPRSR